MEEAPGCRKEGELECTMVVAWECTLEVEQECNLVVLVGGECKSSYS